MAAGGLVPASAVDIQTCPAVQSRRVYGRRGCIFVHHMPGLECAHLPLVDHGGEFSVIELEA
jgi:hypothetical protein